jgi:hypothetical protein
MGIAEAVFAILSASATALGGLGGLLWWVYNRGQASGVEKAKREALEQASGVEKAKREALEQAVAEIWAQLAAIQRRRA